MNGNATSETKTKLMIRLMGGLTALMKDAERVVGGMSEEQLKKCRESLRAPDGKWCCVWCAELEDGSVVAKVVRIGTKDECDKCTTTDELRIPQSGTVVCEFHSVIPARDWIQNRTET